MAYTTIDDPSAYFHTQLFTGTGSELSVTNDANAGDFKPDLIWIKNRAISASHVLTDTTRGATKSLFSDQNAGDTTEAQQLKSFNTDGFTVGTSNNVNGSSNGSVAWQWKANGGTTTSNSNGSITTTVQANTTAGFSIVLYTSASGGQTIGHGLGVKPNWYIIKERSTSGDDWFIYHTSLGAGKKIRLSGDGAVETDTSIWQNTEPTTTVASLQNDSGGVNQNTGGNQNYVAYFFNNVQGYSKFGSYTGNGSSSGGPFVYLGFKPAWLLYRNVDRTENWIIVDNKRNPINRVAGANLQANENAAEANETRWGFDFLSNGFKVRQTQAQNANNGNGEKIIYMAFAEHPFVSSEGVPTTAR